MNPSASGRIGRLLAASLAVLLTACASGPAHFSGERTLTGFAFPESVGCDAATRTLYVSQFGGDKLQPTAKDGQGKIARLAADGKVLDAQFLPTPQGEPLNKPKGIWVQGDRLWVTDIDVVWVFDLKTRQGRKVALPNVKFANDPTVQGNALYVSDNRGDALYRVEPADFLHVAGEPKVTIVVSGKSLNPNGIYPAQDGDVLAVGFMSDKEARGIYSISPAGGIRHLSDNIGRLDGVHQLADGSLLVTDWNSGSLFSWSKSGGMKKITGGFKGPADFCVMPDENGYTAYVPDLVKSEVRVVRFER